jgi:hypothetical protein
MSNRLAAAALAGLVLAGSAPLAPAQPLTAPATQPAISPAPLSGPDVMPPVMLMTPEQMEADVSQAKFWARWACVLAALALAGSLWVGWSMRVLARNQVEIARMVQALGGKSPD